MAHSRCSVSKTEQRLERKSETAREAWVRWDSLSDSTQASLAFSLLCSYKQHLLSHFVLPTECLEQAIQALIITIAISSNVIGALAASFFHFSFCTALIGQHNWTVGFNRIPVIGQLKQRIILSSVSQIHQSQS